MHTMYTPLVDYMFSEPLNILQSAINQPDLQSLTPPQKQIPDTSSNSEEYHIILGTNPSKSTRLTPLPTYQLHIESSYHNECPKTPVGIRPDEWYH